MIARALLVAVLASVAAPVFAGEESSERVAALLKEILSPEKSEKAAAVRALAGLGPESAAAIPPLVKALKSDPSGWVGPRVAKALALLKALEALRGATRSKVANVRANALWGLKIMGPTAKAALPDALRATADAENSVRSAAYGALGAVGVWNADVQKALVDGLEDPNADGRTAAALSLRGFGARAAPALPQLMAAFAAKDTSSLAEMAYVQAIGAIGPKAKAAIPALLAALRGSGPRRDAADALAQIGPAALPGLKEIMEAGGRPARYARAALVDVLSRDRSLDALVTRTQHGLWEVRLRATQDLRDQPPGAQAAKALADCLVDETPKVRRAAVSALRLYEAHALPALAALLERVKTEPDAEIRYLAVMALGAIGPKAKAAIADLTSLVGETSLRLRLAAHTSRARIDARHAPAAVAALKKDLERVKAVNDMRDCLYLAALLEKHAAPLAPHALAGLKSKAARVRKAALRLLPYVTPDLDLLVSLLIDLLEDSSLGVRSGALTELYLLGTKARAAIPALEKIAKEDEDEDMRGAAVRALKDIRGKGK
jgi:HEAT repeat protein